MEFPRLVYKSASVFALAETQEASDALIAAGWFATVPEALAPPVVAPIAPIAPPVVVEAPADATAPPTRSELEQRATELGIKFDGRTGSKKLGDLIAAVIEPDEPAPQ